MIDHPAYQKIKFILFDNGCKIPWDNETDPPSVTRPFADRIYMKDWNDSRGKLPEFESDPLRID